MAKRPNYGGEKRQKEIKRQQKKAEKAERKMLRKGENSENVKTDEPGEISRNMNQS